jgi:hypothetical protein
MRGQGSHEKLTLQASQGPKTDPQNVDKSKFVEQKSSSIMKATKNRSKLSPIYCD